MSRAARCLALAALLVATLTAVLAPARTEAQSRSLHWPQIEVSARLDAEGRLHATERHTMTFNGAWNGGERRFDLRSGQELSVLAMRRLAPAPEGGPPRVVEMSRMTSGASRTDQWYMPAGDTVRWRSRMPSDPPFDATTLVYELEYVLSGVLIHDAGDGTYRLAHEFGFADRSGAIGTLAVRLDLAPAWSVSGEPSSGEPLTWTWRDLAPGASPVVRLDLAYSGPGRPDAAQHPLSLGPRLAPFLAALAAMLILVLGFVGHAQRSARFRPLPDLATPPSRRWLERHVFSRPPEEVGALWDRGVGRAEVSALLARLVAEGKVASRLDPDPASPGEAAVLHLELLVPRDSLAPMAADLLSGLLLERRGDVTSTARVKEHYAGRGFNPSSLIAGHLTAALPEILPAARLHSRWRRRWTPILVTASLVCFAAALLIEPESAAVGAGTALWTLVPTYLVAFIVARLWRRSVHWPLGAVAGLVVPPLLALGGSALLLGAALPWLGMPNTGLLMLPMLTGAALAPLAGLSSVLYRGRLAETEDTVLARRRLRHARRHFAAELERADPDLDDAWLAYLLALGLQAGVADWEERWAVAAPGSNPGLGSSPGLSSAGRGRLRRHPGMERWGRSVRRRRRLGGVEFRRLHHGARGGRARQLLRGRRGRGRRRWGWRQQFRRRRGWGMVTLRPTGRWMAAALVCLVAAAVVAPAAGAASRSLSWPEIQVEARLDAEGRLHVRERQTLRFDGDWNGGERRIHLGSFQELEVEAISRIPAGGGAPIPLTRGDLERVDQWDLVDDGLIRWRSRSPDAPAFDDTVLTYLLEYSLSGILAPVEGVEAAYLLDHEFGFGDRRGRIGRLDVRLTFDPAWRPLDSDPGSDSRSDPGGGAPGAYEESWRDLAPYESPVTRLALRHLRESRGGVRPGAVVFPLSEAVILLPLLLALALMTYLALRFTVALRRSPRVEPLADLAGSPDRQWLGEHLFARPAEDVGALWDREVGAPEVTALLARMVAEGKLRSWTEPPKDSKGRPKEKGKPVLHLELLVPRESLPEDEATLIDGLFFDGDTTSSDSNGSDTTGSDTTDSDRVRRHYTGKGFDPAGLLRPFIAARLPVEEDPGRPGAAGLKRWAWAMLILAVALGIYTGTAVHGELALAAFGAAMVSAMTFSLCLVLASRWRRRVDWPAKAALGFVLPLFAVELFFAVLTLAVARSGMPNPGLALLPFLGTVALLPAASLAAVLHHATSRESRRTVHLRRRLAHARDHFVAELDRAEPDLEDAWMPYLLAFGLAPRVDRWSDRWSVAEPAHGPRPFANVVTGTGSTGAGGRWTGGGGAFGGAGATAGWAAAASGMAGGVSGPSGSGGGGGGGGGGGASGGGGGGGW